MMADDLPPIAPEPPHWSTESDGSPSSTFLAEQAEREREAAKQAPWPDAEPFDAMHGPEFPTAALPLWLREWTYDQSEFCQVPADLPGVMGLAALSCAAARSFDVSVVPGWVEPTNIYAVVGMPPGERKSAVFSAATAPLHDFQTELNASKIAAVSKREQERAILEGQRAAAVKAAIAGKSYGGGDARTAATELAARLVDLPELHVPSLLADDSTPEALAVLLGRSDECVGVLSPEGGPFEMMSGRYSDKGPNLEIYLKGHAADAHTVNRIKREPITLKRPRLTIGLTVQPAVIEGLAGKEGFRGRGLLARFLYSLPRSRVGYRTTEPVRVHEDAERAYTDAILNVLRVRGGDGMLTMAPEAHRMRCDFQTMIEPRLGPDGDLRPIVDWSSKLVGAVCRIAGLLHVAHYAPANFQGMTAAIPGETFARAVAIGSYFLEHAIVAFQLMSGDETTALAKRVWAWVERTEAKEFSERDARRATHADKLATHAEPDPIAPALGALEARGLIRKLPSPGPTGGQPASPRYQVRPSNPREQP